MTGALVGGGLVGVELEVGEEVVERPLLLELANALPPKLPEELEPPVGTEVDGLILPPPPPPIVTSAQFTKRSLRRRRRMKNVRPGEEKFI